MTTRSEIEGWKTDHLTSAAARWRAAADNADSLFDQHRNDVGGADWSGSARDAAFERVTADVGVAQRHGMVQRKAAQLAENGASDINAAKSKVLEAITDAEADGFRVGEDRRVTDARRYDIATIRERNRALAEHAENISWTADQLVQADSLVGQRLQEKAAELDGIRFGSGTIQAASWGGFKQDGTDDEWEPPVIKTEQTPSHVPTVIDAKSDPDSQPNPDMFPGCDDIDVWSNIGQTLLGTTAIAVGIAGAPLTLGTTLTLVTGGGATILSALNDMRHCL
ncbi:hypothetical protein [Mycobacterium sp. DL440]|uniref:hypothetical protein n=1 Tax=Mycobacterium sp. DL440 TaxID=2675523 RepID=UPI001AAFDC4C|nr:hypothetical protein [Mycobacterium sp. DL440]